MNKYRVVHHVDEQRFIVQEEITLGCWKDISKYPCFESATYERKRKRNKARREWIKKQH